MNHLKKKGEESIEHWTDKLKRAVQVQNKCFRPGPNLILCSLQSATWYKSKILVWLSRNLLHFQSIYVWYFFTAALEDSLHQSIILKIRRKLYSSILEQMSQFYFGQFHYKRLISLFRKLLVVIFVWGSEPHKIPQL